MSAMIGMVPDAWAAAYIQLQYQVQHTCTQHDEQGTTERGKDSCLMSKNETCHFFSHIFYNLFYSDSESTRSIAFSLDNNLWLFD